MTLSERVQQDMVAAMKAKDEVAKQALRMLSTALKHESIAKKGALSDEQESAVVAREVKRLRESIDEFRAAGRADLVSAAEAELSVYERYMPAQMGDDALEGVVRATIAEVGAQSAGDVGRVMGAVMQKVKGQADGNRVREIVQRVLG